MQRRYVTLVGVQGGDGIVPAYAQQLREAPDQMQQLSVPNQLAHKSRQRGIKRHRRHLPNTIAARAIQKFEISWGSVESFQQRVVFPLRSRDRRLAMPEAG